MTYSPPQLHPHPTLHSVRWRGVIIFQGPLDQCRDLIARLDRAAPLPFHPRGPRSAPRGYRATGPQELATMAAIKKQRAYARVSDTAPILEMDFYGNHDDKGKGEVVLKGTYDVSALPDAQLHLCAQKGLAAYGSVRAAANGEDPSPEDVKAAYNAVYDEMVAGTFEPGRAMDAAVSVLHEAIAEYLKQPLEAIQKQIKENAGGVFGKEGMAKIARIDEVDAIKQRLIRERAAEKEKAAKARAKAAGSSALSDLQALFGLSTAAPTAAPAA